MHRLILVRFGNLKVRVRDFFRNDIIATVPWYLLVSFLGYISSYSIASVKHYLKYVEVPLIIAVIIFVLLDYSLAKGLKKKL